VQMAANRQAARGFAKTIGTSRASGGIGKKLASAKATSASHQAALGEAASTITRLYNFLSIPGSLTVPAAGVTRTLASGNAVPLISHDLHHAAH
jgi:hypothetical protein